MIIQFALKKLGLPKDKLNNLIDEAADGIEALNLVIQKENYSLIMMDC